MNRAIAAFTITAACLGWMGTAEAALVLDDPLNGSTSGIQDGGQFVAGGWQSPGQIAWDTGVVITEGGFSVEVTNWNPDETSPQHHHDKQHIINMYEAAHGSPHQSDNDFPQTGFFNFRTGATYDNLFKFLSSTAGFTDRIETRVKRQPGFIDPGQTYEIKVTWTAAGDITGYLDGVDVVAHGHGQQFRLQHVIIGTDNAPSNTYGPQHDVIYRNVKVWDDSPVAPDAGAPDSGAGGSPDPVGGSGPGGAGAGGGPWPVGGGASVGGQGTGAQGAGGYGAGGYGTGASPFGGSPSDPLAIDDPSDDEGCSCRFIGGATGGPALPLVALSLLALVALGCRRRR